MMNTDFFSSVDTFPNADVVERYSQLVGLGEVKERLEKETEALLRPDLLEAWSQKVHNTSLRGLELMGRRPPLFVFAGDVGTGKSELAMTFGDRFARQSKMKVQLNCLSLRTRGGGVVGEMTRLISGAFDHIVEEGKSLKSSGGKKPKGALILLIDEADALAQSRESVQMHHEDRAGVNALIRGVDQVANSNIPCLIIMCSNRLDALDPAVLRRSAAIFEFKRPSLELRKDVLTQYLGDTGIEGDGIQALAEALGEQGDRNYGYTFSDITQRLIPSLILAAYPKRRIDGELALQIAASVVPTPPFRSES